MERPSSIRSSTMTWPPASTMQHEIAILALRAFSMAVAIILRAPSWVRRLASAMYMEVPWSAGIVGHAVTTIKGAAPPMTPWSYEKRQKSWLRSHAPDRPGPLRALFLKLSLL